MKYIFLAVEGQHDIAVAGKILELRGIKKKRLKSEVDSFWYRLIPKDFPIDDDLLKRVPVPRFYQGGEVSVAIAEMVGHTGITKTIRSLSAAVDSVKLHALGIICDADDEAVNHRFNRIQNDISSVTDPIISNLFSGLEIGCVSTNIPKAGVFIFPDNSNYGCLDCVLLECAATSYHDILPAAEQYINNVPDAYKAKWKTYDRQKAVVGCIANILRPGKSNQVSLEDNAWVCQSTVTEVEKLQRLQTFLYLMIDN